MESVALFTVNSFFGVIYFGSKIIILKRIKVKMGIFLVLLFEPFHTKSAILMSYAVDK